jgi:hypothetical protein
MELKPIRTKADYKEALGGRGLNVISNDPIIGIK